jgi:sugar O-acyltransferase (sialic acid O-acetyltransferase NeuD family)
MKDLYLIGGGGFASEVLFVIERISKIEKKWKSIFIVDDVKENGDKVREYQVVGNIDYLHQLKEDIDVIITINDPEPRKNIIETLKAKKKNVNFPNIFDTTSIVDEKYLTIGEGNIIMHYVILSTKLVIGNFNIFNSYTGIGHDSVMGDYNSFNPRVAISGKVIINDLNSFGVNSTVLQNKKIGSRNQIWLNTTIVKNLKDDGTYFGIPAKKVEV